SNCARCPICQSPMKPWSARGSFVSMFRAAARCPAPARRVTTLTHFHIPDSHAGEWYSSNRERELPPPVCGRVPKYVYYLRNYNQKEMATKRTPTLCQNQTKIFRRGPSFQRPAKL